MSDFWSVRKYPYGEPHTPLANRVTGGKQKVAETKRKGKETMKKELENRLLQNLASMSANVRDNLKIKGFKVLRIETDEDMRITRYPFRGIYIEVNLEAGNITEESTLRAAIEAAISKKLSCTYSPEMAESQKAVYRVDFEMQNVT